MANSLASGQKPTGVADLDSSQTLENKTLDSTSTVNGSDVIAASIQSPVRADVKKDTLANLQTYALTASNGQLCFATDAKKMYQVLDAALAEVGSGQGGINYISNPDFELNVDGYTSDVNLTIARSTVAPLRGSASGVISKAAVDASGEVVKIPFTIESADLAKKLYISFDKDASDANYADGDLRVEVIKDPNGTPVTIRCNAEDILGGKGSHLAWFQTDASILEYELVFKCNSSNASAYSVKIDNISVGPREVSYGSAMTDWKTYTPTFTGFGTVTNINIEYRRVGSNLEIRGRYLTGTNTATEARISLPNNLVSSDTLTPTLQKVGDITFGNASASVGYLLAEPTQSYLTYSLQSSSSAGLTKLNGTSLASNNTHSIEARVPIKGWSSNSIQSEDIGNREIVVKAQGNSATTLTSNVTPVPFNTTVKDTTGSWSGTQFTVPESGIYAISGAIVRSASADYKILRLYKNNSSFRNISATPNGVSSDSIFFSVYEEFNKGDVVELRIGDSNTTLLNSVGHHIHIQKLAQPQTILETETVAARYTTNSGQSISNTRSLIIFEDKEIDTHNIYNTSNGVVTIPVTGYYQINANITSGAAASQDCRVEIFKNGTDRVIEGIVRQSSPNTGLSPNISTILYLEKGETFIFRAYSNTNSTLDPFAVYNSFSLARIK